MKIILLIVAFFVFGCAASSKTIAPNPFAENNKDVLILSTLIQEYFSQTKDERDITLNEIIKNDTLKRISNNFEKIELTFHGGYISVHYKFSKSRDNRIELSDDEKRILYRKKCVAKDVSEEYDGEIQFDYGERFYCVKKIIVKAL